MMSLKALKWKLGGLLQDWGDRLTGDAPSAGWVSVGWIDEAQMSEIFMAPNDTPPPEHDDNTWRFKPWTPWDEPRGKGTQG